jgi:hypothetical protein
MPMARCTDMRPEKEVFTYPFLQAEDPCMADSIFRGIKLKTEQVSSSNTYTGKMISMDTFCEIITNRKRTQLELVIKDDILVFQSPGRLSQNFLLSSSSIPLAKLLDNAKLSKSWKRKLLLSYLLAKAVWQFYDSDWMHKEWTK